MTWTASPWTPERIAELKRLWALDTPTKLIARKLGTSANAVIGKADRLGLPTHKAAPQRPPARKLERGA